MDSQRDRHTIWTQSSASRRRDYAAQLGLAQDKEQPGWGCSMLGEGYCPGTPGVGERKKKGASGERGRVRVSTGAWPGAACRCGYE